MSNTGKICFCYIVTSVIISLVIYVIILSYLRSMSKIEELQKDIKEIFRDLTDIHRNSISSSTRNHHNQPLEPTCNQEVDKIVQKYMAPLRDELTETKRAVEQLRCQSGLRKQGQTDIMRTDYALESLGGKVYSVKDESYSDTNFFLSIFGLGALSNEPRNILNPSMQPGNCYAFKGSRSTVIIKLMANVFVDSVGIEHITDLVSPDSTVISAPKDFSVYGLTKPDDSDPFYFGSFTYNANLRQPAQIFNFPKLSSRSYNYLKFDFISNHGHPNYTCIYRISVHGKLDKAISSSHPGTKGYQHHSCSIS